MDEISPNTLRPGRWHQFQVKPGRPAPRVAQRWAGILIPLVVAVVLAVAGALIMAGVVVGLTSIIWLIRSVSVRTGVWLDRVLGNLAHGVGQGAAAVLLAPGFYIVLPLIRILRRLGGADPLLLRAAEAPTYWLPSDLETRRARYIRSLFCTERILASRLGLATLAVMGTVLFVAAEAALRIYGFGAPLLYEQDAEVGFYPRPNQRAHQPGRIIRINNVGMRSADVSRAKAAGHVRILMLGDSTLAGTWVSNPELYSSLLEEKLDAMAGTPIFEVMNMGVNAWGPFHELAFAKKFGAYQADVAVICGPVEDCYRPLYGLDHVPFLPAAHPPRFATEQVVYQLLWQIRAWYLGRPPWEATPERTEQQAQLGMDAYAELARELQRDGAEVVFDMLPTSAATLGLQIHQNGQRLANDLRRRVGSLGIPVSLAGPIFKGAKLKQIYHDGVHFTRLGHARYADYLAAHLCQTSQRIRQAVHRP